MMDDQRDAYIAQHPEVLTMPLPDGWRRLDSMPLDCPIQFLLNNGDEYSGVGASNPAFLIDTRVHIAWQPIRLEDWQARIRERLTGRVSDKVMEGELTHIRKGYERRGWA